MGKKHCVSQAVTCESLFCVVYYYYYIISYVLKKQNWNT